MNFFRRYGVMALLALACAGTPKRTTTAGESPAPPPRLKDSVPERAAAQRAATPGLQLEAQDERWGVEAAKERKRQQEESRAAAKPPPGAAGKGVQVVPPPSASPR